MEVSIFSVADHHPEFEHTPRQLYAELLESAEMAKRLGIEMNWVAEHQMAQLGHDAHVDAEQCW